MAGSRPQNIYRPVTGWLSARDLRSSTMRSRPTSSLSCPSTIGMEASDSMLRWLWKKKLSLVGTDNPAFESVPFNATIDGVPRALHQVFIRGWGQSIVCKTST
ncbi:hypothetical protein DFH07DRAFT_812306 [Mycena maculata]|uniref:Uncharacterized protein n=1 Tax=Mycena maculata TaxID=230809 RepID=A0AAD7JHI5_9AGAR|nr:hypothetical protein DFH07DRAFT_812306 [Mycena maculata]